MNMRAFLCIGAIVVMSGPALAEAVTYQPLGKWIEPHTAALAAWAERSPVHADGTSGGRAGDTRPALRGQRIRSVELLEDALLRKYPKLLENNPERARQLILRRYSRAEGPLRGYMAEAMFIDRNPDWHYVSKPNATQHDVYRWLEGQRPPYTGQIKYHDSGEPRLYARDMVADYRSPRFFIPNDHVEPVRKYLLAQMEGADSAERSRLQRDYARLRPIGASSLEIRSATTEAAQRVARESYSSYVSIGPAFVLALGPVLMDLAAGDATANEVAYSATRSLSILGVGYGTDRVLAHLKGGALRGGMPGFVIVGTSLAIAETMWLLYDHGWQQAFYKPGFYVELVGSVSAIGLGLATGPVATSLAAGTGPLAPWIGLGAAVVAGSIGYVGGRGAVRVLQEIVGPDRMRAEEQRMFSDARVVLDSSAQALQNTR